MYLSAAKRLINEILNYGDTFTADFNKFVDKKSNKIKIIFNGVKKLLPYNGFYPSQRTVQIVSDFSGTYLSDLSEREKQYAIQPFFAPGILFNSIKAGIAVDFPIVVGENLAEDDILGATIFWQYKSAYNYGTNQGSRAVRYFSERLPFEAILDPKNYLFNTNNDAKNYYYLDPTHYNWLFTSGSALGTTQTVPYVELKKITNSSAQKTDFYELAINNFIAEIPNFFLENSELTNFVSLPDTQFNTVLSGAVYQMKISIDKNSNFSSFKKTNYSLSASSGFWFDSSEQTLYGPVVTNLSASTGYYNFAVYGDSYAPFTPAYYRSNTVSTITESITVFDGFKFDTGVPSWFGPDFRTITNSSSLGFNEIRLDFCPNTNGIPTVADIISKTKIITPSTHTTSSYTNHKWAMSLLSSLLVNQKVSSPSIAKDPITGKIIQTVDDTSTNRLAIQTKFEVPLIDFQDTIASSTITPFQTPVLNFDDAALPEYGFTADVTASIVDYQGIWNSYGTIPEDGKSIQIKVSDDGASNSLMNIIGLKPQSKSIGKIADKKVISEAVVILPYLNKQVSRVRRPFGINLLDPFPPEGFVTNKTENKYLFKIEDAVINKLLNVPNYKNLSIKDIKLILDTDTNINRSNSIVDLMIKMVTYNIPPHLNWLETPEKKQPCVMFIGEFTHELTKQDLADIWQGTMPSITKNSEEQSVSLEYFLGEQELFGNLNLNDYDISMSVFKAKKRANTDYKQITLDPNDANEKIPWYTYNWPYDYFSLVELLNIQAGEVYEPIASGSV